MCGISGVFHYLGGVADAQLVGRQSDVQRHRGPDDSGLWSEGPVALAHRRLSIIDLSPGGHQPLPNEDESIWVTYNGELYGWPELRSDLAARGHRFRGSSDTEALLHLYEEHGEQMMQYLRGMFAFALFDRTRSRLLIGRDRTGQKPLYYHDDGKRIAFASELKALMLDPSVPRDVDARAMSEYLSLQYVPSPRSIWKGVQKLPPGHILICDRAGVQVKPYWSLPAECDPSHSRDWYVERLRALLTEAVRIRMVSDVPLGAFLSGGIDSSAVVALMTRVSSEQVKTFSIGFDDEDFSELKHARRVAEHLGTDHHEFVVKPHALELLPKLVWQMDEPFADASMIPTSYVSEMARRHVTVVLSGDGGDEAYGGYVTYAWAKQYARMDWVPRAMRRLAGIPAAWLHGDDAIGRKLRRLSMDVVDRHLDVMSMFDRGELWPLLSRDMRAEVHDHDPLAVIRAHHVAAARSLGDIPALLHLDARTYMTDDVLAKVDRASMMHSLEARAPLLDHHVLEFVSSIPFEYKLRGDVSKWVLRESVRDALPPEILSRGKQGFGVPLDRWFDGSFGPLARSVLLDPAARRRGWFDPARIEALLDDRRIRVARRSRQLWTLVCLELWAQTYLDRPRDAVVAPLPSNLVVGGQGRSQAA